MFKRNKCSNCKSSISKKFDFCPYCGHAITDNEDYGMLGKNDEMKELDRFSKSLFPGFGGKMLNKMLGNAMKMLEKEMQKELKDMKNSSQPKTDFQMFINGKKVNFDQMDHPLNHPPHRHTKINRKKPEKRKLPHPDQETLEKSAKLPRKQAKTKLKRDHNKIIYEIDIPGVDSDDKLLINKLEDSTEIKAFAKTKVWTKNLPIKLPLLAYYFKTGKLFLEFQGK